MSLPIKFIQAANYTRGSYSKGYICLHSVQCPPGYDWAESLAIGYFANPATMASTQYIVDADTIVRMTPEDAWTWSTGSPGSKHGIHIEQAGYAEFTRAMWLGTETPGSTYKRPNGQVVAWTSANNAQMKSQFELLVRLIVDICTRRGWKAVAADSADLNRMVDGANLGRHVRHIDVTEWVGGTSHWDPGPNYPWQLLLDTANARLKGIVDPPKGPVTPPADDITEEDDGMRILKTTDSKKRGVWALLRGDGKVQYISDGNQLAMYRAAGIPEKTVTRAQYNSARATGTNKVT